MRENFEQRIDFLDTDYFEETKNTANKVYFTSHPDDFDNCYRRISNDLFKYSGNNCIIYRKKTEAEISDEDIGFIEKMTLVVVPVTRKLLLEDNPALREVEYAISKGVSVLPFMMETGIDDLYENSVFQKRQWISQFSTGKDVIPYHDKLKRFLDGRFTDDKTVRCVKSEFSSRIFLSYRKKDRQYAKPLMQDIHSKSRLRDVAIWYDEFLPLTKDYALSISEEIDKSRAVVFLVTENLAEEKNYVKDVEYPSANDKKKTILPIETNKDEQIRLLVKNSFDKVYCAEDGIKFPDYVEIDEIPDKIEIDDKEDTPQHKYYIGLAYLEGIDMERDAERALSLFEPAAAEGNLNAAKMLLTMYRDGLGTDIDNSKSIYWCGLIIDRFESLGDKLLELHYRNCMTDLMLRCDDMEGLKSAAERAYILSETVCDGQACPDVAIARNNYLMSLVISDDPGALSEVERINGSYEDAFLDYGKIVTVDKSYEMYYTNKYAAMAYMKAGDFSQAQMLYNNCDYYASIIVNDAYGDGNGVTPRLWECTDVEELKKYSVEYLLGADAHNSICVAYCHDSRTYDDAVQLGYRAYEIRSAILGEDSPATKIAKYNLSVAYYKVAKSEYGSSKFRSDAECEYVSNYKKDVAISMLRDEIVDVMALPYSWVCEREEFKKLLAYYKEKGLTEKIEDSVATLEDALLYFADVSLGLFGITQSIVLKLIEALKFSRNTLSARKIKDTVALALDKCGDAFGQNGPKRILAIGEINVHSGQRNESSGIITALFDYYSVIESREPRVKTSVLKSELDFIIRTSAKLLDGKKSAGLKLSDEEVHMEKELKIYRGKLAALRRISQKNR